MSKIIYDVIQRFEVENGVPRLIATNIQVIQGGEDLLSLATSMLNQLGFYDKFEENRTSQYIGYRLKNPGKGAKRYQLVLAPRKEGLCIYVPKDDFNSEILSFDYFNGYEDIDIEDELGNVYSDCKVSWVILGKFWIRPSKEDVFWESMQSYYPNLLQLGQTTGTFLLNVRSYLLAEGPDEIDISRKIDFINSAEEFNINCLGNSDNYLVINWDKLFPYAWQVCVSSRELLEEFLGHFVKIIMERK